jgi:hypothetical protein
MQSPATTYNLRCGETAQSIRIAPDESVVVGRDPKNCDIVLGGTGVSRIHVRLTNRGGQLMMEDLKPRQHMVLNGEIVPFCDHRQLMPGDLLAFCGYGFVVEAGACAGLSG